MSDVVVMTASDTFHASNLHSDNIREGDVFLVSEADAKHFKERGLAERGGKAEDAVNAPGRRAPTRRPETREDIDAEREGKALKSAPENKAHAPIAAKRK